jgi:hypothetical protein
MGIYSEVAWRAIPQRVGSVSRLGAVIEQSDPDYTNLLPGRFTHDEAIDYQITQKGEPSRGHDLSLNSLTAHCQAGNVPPVVRPLQPRRE